MRIHSTCDPCQVADAVAAAVQKVKKEEKEDEEKKEDTEEEEEMMDWALATLKRTQYLSESSSEEEGPIQAPSKHEPSPRAEQSSQAQVSHPSTIRHGSVPISQGDQASVSAGAMSDDRAVKREPSGTEDGLPQMTCEETSVDPLSVPVKEESSTSSAVKKEEKNEDGTAELITPDPLPVPEYPKAEAEPVLAACLEQQCVMTEPRTDEQASGDSVMFRGLEDTRNPCETKEMLPTSVSTVQQSNHFSPTAINENTSLAVESTNFVPVTGPLSVLVYDSDDFGAMDVDSEDHSSSTEVEVEAQCSSSSLAAVHCETERRGPLSSQGSASAVSDADESDSSEDHRWKCICDRSFRNRCDLDKHQKTHFIDGKWKCCFCDKKFTRLCTLVGHRKTHSRQEESYETLDGSAQESSSDIPHSPRVEPVENISPDTSAPSTNANENWVCIICDKNFSFSQDLEKHCKTHFIEGKWKCFICDKTFSHLGGIISHRKTHFRQEESSVTLDGAVQESSSDIPDSPRVEPVENISPDTSVPPTNANENWVCNLCDKNFSCSQDLWKHRKIHFIEGKWRCCFCDKAFADLRGITNHRKTHSGQEESSYITVSQIIEPVKNISSVSSVIPPLIKFSDENDRAENQEWMCKICDKRFRIYRELKNHLKSHFMNGKWRCCFCDKSFSHLCGITSHRKTHFRNENNCEELEIVAQSSSSNVPLSGKVMLLKNISSATNEISISSKDIDSPVFDANETSTSGYHTLKCSECNKYLNLCRDLNEQLKINCGTDYKSRKWKIHLSDTYFSYLCQLAIHVKTHFTVSDSAVELKAAAQHSSADLPLSGKVVSVETVSSASLQDIDIPLIDLEKDEIGNSAMKDQKLMCNICDKNFLSFPALDKHRRVHFNSKNRTFVFDETFSNLCRVWNYKKVIPRESVDGTIDKAINQSGEEQYNFRKRSKCVNLYTSPPHDDDDDDDGDDEEKDGKNRVADDDSDYTMDHDNDDDDSDTEGSDYLRESYDDDSKNDSGKSKVKNQEPKIIAWRLKLKSLMDDSNRQRLSSPSSRGDTVRTILNRNGGRGSDCFCVNRACTSITEQMLAYESSMLNATSETVNKSLVLTRQSPPSQHNATVTTKVPNKRTWKAVWKAVLGKELKCFKCKEMITTVEEAREHAKKHFSLSAEDEGNLCPICHKPFGTEDTILDHISLHWPHKCDDCGRRYANSVVLGFHKTRCYKEDRGCPLCANIVKDPTKLSEHLRIVMKSTCPLCGECYKTPNKLKPHIMWHFGIPIPPSNKSGGDYYRPKSHICKRCNGNFPSNRYLMKHRKACKRTIDKIKKVRKKQRLQCDKCKKSYTTRYMLRKHIFKFCYKSLDKNFECDQCNEWFAEELLLRDHIRSVHQKSKQCEICGKTFKHLKVHMKTHTLERNFSCAECGDSFRQKHHLENHMRKHTGERPYKCEQCGDRFKTTGHLINHRETHKPPEERRRVVRKNAPITFAKKIND